MTTAKTNETKIQNFNSYTNQETICPNITITDKIYEIAQWLNELTEDELNIFVHAEHKDIRIHIIANIVESLTINTYKKLEKAMQDNVEPPTHDEKTRYLWKQHRLQLSNLVRIYLRTKFTDAEIHHLHQIVQD